MKTINDKPQTINPKPQTTNDKPQTPLSPGQAAVIDAYLSRFTPAEEYNPDTDWLLDTQSIILETDTMCSFDPTALADHLTLRGFRPHRLDRFSDFGWILRPKPKN